MFELGKNKEKPGKVVVLPKKIRKNIGEKHGFTMFVLSPTYVSLILFLMSDAHQGLATLIPCCTLLTGQVNLHIIQHSM